MHVLIRNNEVVRIVRQANLADAVRFHRPKMPEIGNTWLLTGFKSRTGPIPQRTARINRAEVSSPGVVLPLRWAIRS